MGDYASSLAFLKLANQVYTLTILVVQEGDARLSPYQGMVRSSSPQSTQSHKPCKNPYKTNSFETIAVPPACQDLLPSKLLHEVPHSVLAVSKTLLDPVVFWSRPSSPTAYTEWSRHDLVGLYLCSGFVIHTIPSVSTAIHLSFRA